MAGLEETIKVQDVLPESRQRDLIRRAQAGDEHAANLVVQHNAKMVYNLSRQFYGIKDHEDILADGFVGLTLAIQRFDLNRKKNGRPLKFSTFAFPYIRGVMLDGLKKGRPKETEAHLDKPMSFPGRGGETLTLLDTLVDEGPTPDEIAETEHMSWHMTQALDEHLDERRARILRMYFGIGRKEAMSQREIAEVEDLSPGRIYDLIKDSLTRLREAMADQEEVLRA